jgi:hypothetical protein
MRLNFGHVERACQVVRNDIDEATDRPSISARYATEPDRTVRGSPSSVFCSNSTWVAS